MRVLTYPNTKTDPKISPARFHEWFPRGYAYEDATHFVHRYGSNSDLWMLTPGISVVSEAHSGGHLNGWIDDHFGATDVRLEIQRLLCV